MQTIREIKVRPNCNDEDYKFKLDHAIRFLGNKDQVKITVMFRGREVVNPDRGKTLLLRFMTDLENYANGEWLPIIDRTKMDLMLTPKVV